MVASQIGAVLLDEDTQVKKVLVPVWVTDGTMCGEQIKGILPKIYHFHNATDVEENNVFFGEFWHFNNPDKNSEYIYEFYSGELIVRRLCGKGVAYKP